MDDAFLLWCSSFLYIYTKMFLAALICRFLPSWTLSWSCSSITTAMFLIKPEPYFDFGNYILCSFVKQVLKCVIPGKTYYKVPRVLWMEASCLSYWMRTVGSMVDKPKPGSDVSKVFGSRKVSNCFSIVGDDLTCSLVILNPENSTMSAARTNFVGFWMILFLSHVSSHRQSWKNTASSESDH